MRTDRHSYKMQEVSGTLELSSLGVLRVQGQKIAVLFSNNETAREATRE